MFFIFLLLVTTLAIAGSAAFFSVYGLAQIFSGSFLPVVVMAGSLEAGKLITASFLYQYWKVLTFSIKSYLIAAVGILMLITSLGIFGFLSAAHQKDILPLQQIQQEVVLLEQQKQEIEKLKEERLERKKQIDQQVANLPDDRVKGRQALSKTFESEQKQILSDVTKFNDQITQTTLKLQELKSKELIKTADTGPIVFIANALGSGVENATVWIIILIMFAFDPLAVALTIGVNIALRARKEQQNQPVHVIVDNTPIVEEEVIANIASTEQIQAALEKLSNKELSPAEIAQRAVLEQLLRRQQITDRVRSGNKM